MHLQARNEALKNYVQAYSTDTAPEWFHERVSWKQLEETEMQSGSRIELMDAGSGDCGTKCNSEISCWSNKQKSHTNSITLLFYSELVTFCSKQFIS